MKDWL